MTAETVELSGQKSAPASLRAWAMGWGVVVAVLAVLLAKNAALDTLAWRATRWCMGTQDGYNWQDYQLEAKAVPDAPFYRTAEPPLHGKLYRRTEKFWRVFHDVGGPYMMVPVLILVWIYDRRRWRAAAIVLAAIVLASGLSAILGTSAGRLPPNGVLANGSVNDGANFWQPSGAWLHGVPGGFAFPSGQATLAFALAGALVCLSPRGRMLFLFLAGCGALAQVVMLEHFYSDVLAGAALGYTVGYFTTAWLSGRFAPVRDL